MRSPWELIDALFDYASHGNICKAVLSNFEKPCDCGFDKLAREAERYLEAIRTVYGQEAKKK